MNTQLFRPQFIDRVSRRINTSPFINPQNAPVTPNIGTGGGRVRVNRTGGQGLTPQRMSDGGLPGHNFPTTNRNIQKLIGNTPQNTNVLNLARPFKTTQVGSFSDDNRATQTIIPMVWTQPGTGYDRSIRTGDLLFGDDYDEVVETQYSMPMRTVLKFQDINREMFFGKKDAIRMMRNVLKRQSPHVNIDNIGELDVNYDELVSIWRVKDGGKLMENFEFNRDYRKATAIMNKYVTDWENKMNPDTGHGNQIYIDFTGGVIQQMWDHYDNLRVHSILNLAEIFDKKLVFLHPTLIRNKYNFLGSQVDSMHQLPIKNGKYTRMATTTIVVRGPEYITNVFGDNPLLSGLSRRKTHSKRVVPFIRNFNSLHIVLINQVPNSWKGYMNLKGKNLPKFNPTWAIPYLSPTKANLINKFDTESPFVETVDNLGFKEKIRIFHTSATSWYIGKILAVMPSKLKPPGFYPRSWGLKNHSLSGMGDVNNSRNVAGLLKIDIKNA